MTDYEELHYPHLVSCRVTLMGEDGSLKPQVKLPEQCLLAANAPHRDGGYDFSLERNVLKKLIQREKDEVLVKAQSHEEQQATTLKRMKSITGQNDDICLSLLKSNAYDLKKSVEAFYLR